MSAARDFFTKTSDRSTSLNRQSPRPQSKKSLAPRRRNKAAGLNQSEFFRYATTVDNDGDTPLHKACAENHYKEAETIFKRLIDMPGGREELKKMLLLKNDEGLTPIDAAIAAAGDSDSGAPKPSPDAPLPQGRP